MPQLDGLRAFAVAGVLTHHYTGDNWPTGANMGVKLFFVLSGFLITGILLRGRDASASSRHSTGTVLWHFYMRRLLRIFPLYYFVIAVAYALNLEYVREYIVWLLTYTLNIKMAHQGWFISHFAHFWTLSVEEQFYIFWPWIVLLAPRRAILPLAAVMVAVGPGYRLYHIIMWDYFGSQVDGLRTYIFTLACFDTLGMGALLAILLHSEHSQACIRRIFTMVVLPFSLLSLVGLKLAERFASGWKFNLVFGDLALALFYSWLILGAASGFRGIVRPLLEAKPMTYLGRISYGLYVYHPFAPGLLFYLSNVFGWHYPSNTFLRFTLPTLATVLVASLSWHLFESPINNMKRYFR
jgi:peptidoglycan/LPS O-acetylase OafA/YrhL